MGSNLKKKKKRPLKLSLYLLKQDDPN
ncbi:hypothetical protein TorRG33x02_120760 [Trema orientale]|uniref:Uncharacterized protein n=1 Tax=Trema orientale TaxID=63057 RepID=A0A2P5F380_TREOI|nr:hypothetical protein TorRG33x02_120760 [Trema orientale]